MLRGTKLRTSLFFIVVLSAGFMAPARAAIPSAVNLPSEVTVNHRPVCPITESNQGEARCQAEVVTDSTGVPLVSALGAFSGYSPAQFHTGYGVSGVAANPVTIAVVDAYDDPKIKADLDSYDSHFGLPNFPSCSPSITSGCFKKVNQTGGTTYPSSNAGWSLEIALDVETVHQMCQNCTLLLVEATTASMTNLLKAVDEARTLGAKVISNSYGGPESSTETSHDTHFNYAGIAFTVSSGDSGYGVEYPAASRYVTAVGGTTLHLNTDNSWKSETVWSGAGSGCSAYETKPSFQADSGCGKRTVADVSADADPATGAAVYDSVKYQGASGWLIVGGTSLASPLIAGLYGLAGGVSSSTWANSLPYSNGSYGTNLHDITSGTNGSCGSYLCGARSGYDGPSGLGSPKGFGAF